MRKSPVDTRELKNVMPGSSFTKHIHAGFNLHYREIPYGRDIFMFDPRFEDTEYLKNQNIEFLWDIMQVKYLIIGPEFSSILDGFTNNGDYRLLGNYPKLNLNLYEITKNKSYSKLAILPLGGEQDYNKVIEQLNSSDIDKLKSLYSQLIFLDENSVDFSLLNNTNYNNKRYYEINSKQRGILIDFESWNRNWGFKINNENEKLQKAFQIFNGIEIKPGLNRIEMTYNLKYFTKLFLLGMIVTLIYIALLGMCYYKGKNHKLKEE